MSHGKTRELLRHCKLIDANNDEESLKLYSRELLYKYIEKKLVYFPNRTQVTDKWNATALELLDSVIICDEMPITDMHPILNSELDNNKNELVLKSLKGLKFYIVKSAFFEMVNTLALHNIPKKEDFLNEIDKYSPLAWDAGTYFGRSIGQN